jgi:hypothetical protein
MGFFSWLRRHATRLATPQGCEFAVIHKAFFLEDKTRDHFESKFRASAVGRYPHEIGILQGPWKGRKLGYLCSIYAYIEKDRKSAQR